MNGRTSQTELDELHMATLPDGSHHIHPLLSFLSSASFSSSSFFLLPLMIIIFMIIIIKPISL
ncbi:uncharacterized protein BO87DRAFT_22752 [Aspergillus neoniger CBS 115656]|uniref:Transmembrane protein n=1 Tax=Aspergillus neoniger (strain CBS 115656) TaxID=1448310 RepID=A0A318YMA1_ASPNB|nr:hypothetical protein BO87DRAFT_22752 [Aspergillus neoniger CBS 115656]PYH35741.1 hypothetical protein BO87DRAFT_22752 [Aspergillus neoniger CBS 115656]